MKIETTNPTASRTTTKATTSEPLPDNQVEISSVAASRLDRSGGGVGVLMSGEHAQGRCTQCGMRQ